jgi:hypothetical protein
MNRLQRHNQRELASALRKSLLVKSIELSRGHLVSVQTVDWEQYWGRCNAERKEVRHLHIAWHAFLAGG